MNRCEAATAISGARWILALHHHLVEYPMPAKAFSERIGTALINGSWFVRQLEALDGAPWRCTATAISIGSVHAAR